MRNYLKCWFVKTGNHSDPSFFDTDVFATELEMQVEIENISDPFYVADFGLVFFQMNKANLVNVLTNFAKIVPNFYNLETAVFVRSSPRDTWSHGH